MTWRTVRERRHVASLGRWSEPLDRLALYVCVALGIGSGFGSLDRHPRVDARALTSTAGPARRLHRLCRPHRLRLWLGGSERKRTER